ncbi:MAG: excinuclease ABC subunit C [Ignavibacteriae bacterium HGW-Ignavibacteriae-3]|nr:MAG: excinuclease ABC subunit C [Ignavibacteriae bacterium HGW-Ignavibacteriae-3]
MNTFTTYILYSRSKNRYYVGHTGNFSRRFIEHNSGQNISTKFGAPWELIFTKEFTTKSDAYHLEIKIKKRGISRFLSDHNLPG